MTTNKPGSVNQTPLYYCSHCINHYEDWLWPADDLRVHDGECWCDSCWEVRQEDFPFQPSWYELEPFTPTPQEAQPEMTVPEIIKAVANYVGSQKGGPFTPAVIKASILGQLEYGDAFVKLLTSPATICSQQSTVLGGEYKLMPARITEEKAKALWEEYSKNRTDGLLTRCYKAMYAVAPQHSPQSEEVTPLELENPKYLYGQRVVVDNDTIATFSHYENRGRVTEALWVVLPGGVVQWKSPHNVKPLPGGQL